MFAALQIYAISAFPQTFCQNIAEKFFIRQDSTKTLKASSLHNWGERCTL